jgi:hypothetical protein
LYPIFLYFFDTKAVCFEHELVFSELQCSMSQMEAREKKVKSKIIQADADIESQYAGDKKKFKNAFTANEWKLVDHKNFASLQNVKSLSKEKRVLYFLYNSKYLVSNENIKLYLVEENGHKDFKSAKKIKELEDHQIAAYFANCASGISMNDDDRMFFLVKGGLAFKEETPQTASKTQKKRTRSISEADADEEDDDDEQGAEEASEVDMPEEESVKKSKPRGGSVYVIADDLTGHELLRELLKIDESKLSAEWWESTTSVMKLKLQSLFVVEGSNDANTFLGGSEQERYTLFTRLLNEAREANRWSDSEQIDMKKKKKKKEKEGKRKASSESSESSESMVYDLHAGSTREDVERLFPPVGELNNDYQFKDYARDEYIRLRMELVKEVSKPDPNEELLNDKEKAITVVMLAAKGHYAVAQVLKTTSSSKLETKKMRDFTLKLQKSAKKKGKDDQKLKGSSGNRRHDSGSGGRGRGRSHITCHKCHRTGHYANQCRSGRGRGGGGGGRGGGGGGRGQGAPAPGGRDQNND